MWHGRTRAIAWLELVLWMGLIFALSAIPDLSTGLQPLWDLVLRKFAHAAEYLVLGWLVVRAFERSGAKRGWAVFFGTLLGIVYAATDEYHQTFVLGRHGAVLDATIDSFGVLLGSLVRFRMQ